MMDNFWLILIPTFIVGIMLGKDWGKNKFQKCSKCGHTNYGMCKWGCGREAVCSCGKCDSDSCYAGCLFCDNRGPLEILRKTNRKSK